MTTVFGALLLCASLLAAAGDVAAGPTPQACSAPGQIQASAITLVGEVHGTVEAPGWVAGVACALARQGEVVVALEIPRSEQERIDAFMRSGGAPRDRSDLLSGRFWNGQDGRASEAMAALIDAMRALSAAGAKIQVVAIDDWSVPGGRDAAMAAGIRELHARLPQARIVALLGNLHARSRPREPSQRPGPQPVGQLLQDLEPLTVLADYQGGQAWACTPRCGPLPLTSPWGAEREPGYYPDESPHPGYDATVNLGRVTLSPPVSQRRP